MGSVMQLCAPHPWRCSPLSALRRKLITNKKLLVKGGCSPLSASAHHPKSAHSSSFSRRQPLSHSPPRGISVPRLTRGANTSGVPYAMGTGSKVSEERVNGGDAGVEYTGTASVVLQRRIEGLGMRCLGASAPSSTALKPGEFQIVRQQDIPVGAVVIKSLVWEYFREGEEKKDEAGGRPLLCCLRLHRRVDAAKLVKAVSDGGVGVKLMGVDLAKRVSGFDMGYVPPLGHVQRMRTVVDAELLSPSVVRSGCDGDGDGCDGGRVVFGGGGSTGFELRIRLDDLLRYSGATVVEFSTAEGVPGPRRSRKQGGAESSEDRPGGGEGGGPSSSSSSSSTSVGLSARSQRPTSEGSPDLRSRKEGKASDSISSGEWPGGGEGGGPSSSSSLGLSARSQRRQVIEVTPPTAAAFRKAATKAGGAEEIRALLRRCGESGRGDTAAVAMLLNGGSEESGKTALHLAAWRGSVESVGVLLDAGADIDAYSTGQGNYGKTAIFYALTRCRDEMVAFLLARGADVLICNNKGQTPRSIAVTHVSKETVAMVEAAEVAQEARGGEWRNFRATHSDGKSYGDLDPRFGLDAANGWAPGSCGVSLGTTGFKSVRPTSREARLARHANSPAAAASESKAPSPVQAAQVPSLPFLTTASNYCHLVGIVTSKRRIGRALAFLNIVPPPDPECPDQCAPFLGDACASSAPKLAWRGGGPLGSDPLAVQLIIGRTVKQRLGLDGAAEAIKQLRVGQLVHVVGRIGVNGERGERNLLENSTVDVVTSEVRVLQENYRLQPKLHHQKARQLDRSSAPPDSSRSGHVPTSAEEASRQQNPLRLHHVLQLLVSKTGLSTSADALPRRVLMIDSVSALSAFVESLREMRVRGDDSSTVNTKAVVSACIGLDCEWAPGPKGGRASPVALLQLATPTATYLLDLQVLCRPWLPPDAAMDEAEKAVHDALQPIFTDPRLAFVGFGIEGDLSKLALSFPHLPCFREVSAAVEIRTILSLAYPQQWKRDVPQTIGLAQLCERVLGRGLDKAQQCSDWSSRPLSPEQLEYAALDAAVLLALFAHLAEQPSVCDCETSECVQRCVFGERHIRRGWRIQKRWTAP